MQKKKVFLASSSELKADRQAFEIVINRKNKDWVEKDVFLELIIWEDYLDALSQTRLQDEYNKAIRECDLFVMLFATKVGKYTAEEFDTAFGQFRETNRPFIYTYFKEAAVSTDRANKLDLMSLWAFQEKLDALGHFYTRYENIDALKLHFTGQLDKLAANGFIELKPHPSDGGRPAPTTTYQASVTGGGAVAQGPGAMAAGAGAIIVKGNLTQNIQAASAADAERDEANRIVAQYLDLLARDLSGLDLGRIDAGTLDGRREPLQLADVYVPLDTHLQVPKDMTLAQWLAADKQSDHRDLRGDRETRRVPTLEALAAHRTLTILGKPGSGKSTFGASVLLALAQARQDHPDELRKLGDTWAHGALLPIRVVLRRFADELPHGIAKPKAGDLWAYIGRELQGGGLPAQTLQNLQRIASDDGALFLLDGLDECGGSDARGRVRAVVDDLVRRTGANCRFILTARPYAWPQGPDPKAGVYALADLSDAQVEQFIDVWYRALEARRWPVSNIAARKQNLLDEWRRTDLQPLARNPLLLTLTASLHASKGQLPDDRADLYHESIELLLRRWNEEVGADKALLDALAVPALKLSDLRRVLEEVAYQVHAESQAEAEIEEGGSLHERTADIGEDRLVRAFLGLLKSKDKADIVVDYIEKRAGLLIGKGEKGGERQFAFPHRTFQEFLAACFLAAQIDFTGRCVELLKINPGHWWVVLPLAARIAGPERGISAADELIGGRSIEEARRTRQPDVNAWTSALAAGMQLQEIGAAVESSERMRAIKARVTGWLTASLSIHPDQGGASASQRAYAGDVLSALGDPRFASERLYLPADDMLGFVRVAADAKFCIGTRRVDAKRVKKAVGYEPDDHEINQSLTPTPEFYIARYPVTVAQFRAFVEGAKFELGDEDALRDPDTRPVHYVSWHEALAYCDWLTDALASRPEFAAIPIARLIREQRWRATLPSELEWEKAARGGARNTVFPWGDEPDPERANYGDTDINTTAAVGCFGANGVGLSDMVGNVWEWTRSLWGSEFDKPSFGYPYRLDEQAREDLHAGDEVLRVVRGGSWLNNRSNARCAVRGGNLPDGRGSLLGFRVVLRAAPVP